MSSSLRNAVKRKTHKERAQPSGRKRLGLLEKHKDYVLRARDFASKSRRLTALRRKAELRNRDEFYFGMVHARTERGVQHRERTNEASNVSGDVLALYRTQSAAYMDAAAAHERHRVERLRGQLHFLGGATAEGSGADANADADPGADLRSRPRHIVFVDSDAEADAFDAAEYFDTAPELVDATPYNRPTRAQLAERELVSSRDPHRGRKGPSLRRVGKGYEELARAEARVAGLENARKHLQLKRDLQGKGKRRKLSDAEGDKPAVYVWRTERRR